MILYNTRTRKKETFKPLNGKTARVYSCGPTVYYSAHIGNMRAYIFTDILKKAIEMDGWKLFDVMNITDVGHLVTDADDGEDKIEKSAKALKITPQEIAAKYTAEFLADCDKLNIRRTKVLCPATEHINEMIQFVKTLEQKGLTYTTSDGVYFDASKFKDYFALSGAVLEGNKGGVRVDIGEKRNANDFALWKFCGPEVIQKWPSPWGVGCPGWHIECSAMALKYLGETFDIHTGGIDAIPIHHTNEIAQTESLTGKRMCEFWCHNEFMTVDNGKMSKSLGNTYTLTQLSEKGFSPMDFRYFVLLGRYRTILNFTFEGLRAAQNAYRNLIEILAKHKQSNTKLDANKTKVYYEDFKTEIFDDLNTPKAIAVMWQAVKESFSCDIYDLVIKMDAVLSLGISDSVSKYLQKADSIKEVHMPALVKTLAEKRLQAKKQKDFTTADKIRDEIGVLGYEIIDTKEGYTISRR